MYICYAFHQRCQILMENKKTSISFSLVKHKQVKVSLIYIAHNLITRIRTNNIIIGQCKIKKFR